MRSEALAVFPQFIHLHAGGDGWIWRETVVMAARLFLARQPLHISRQSDRLVSIRLIGKFQRRYNNNHASLLQDTAGALLHFSAVSAPLLLG